MLFKANLSILIIIILLFSSCQQVKKPKEQLDFGLVQYTNAYPDLSDYYGDTSKLLQPLDSSVTGITFSNYKRETLDDNLWIFIYSIFGAGVGVGDINNDGLDDIYFAGNENPNALYLNEGRLHFKDISKSAGINDSSGFSTGVTMVDINADGWLDIYVCRSGPKKKAQRKNLLYINNGDLTFTESAAKYGLDADDYSTHANFFDYDLDGDLDLYLLNHPNDFKDRDKLTGYDKIEKGINQSDKLYRNNGDGTFSDISKEAGINNHGYGLSVSVGDLNNDGWPDVFVANDFAMNDFVYINQKDGTFKESIREVLDKTSHFAMGSDLADFNNDGLIDLCVADIDYVENYRRQSLRAGRDLTDFSTLALSGFFYQYNRNCIQLNNGDGTFSEIGFLAGLTTTNWSWSVMFGDFDNDGWKDYFAANGFFMKMSLDDRDAFKQIRKAIRKKDTAAYIKFRKMIPQETDQYANFIFQNNHDLTFTNKVKEWGTEIPTQTLGAIYADLDNDGDLEIIVNNNNETSFIYKNNENEILKNNYLEITLQYKDKNPFAIGSRVYVVDSARQIQMRHLSPVKGYQSCTSTKLHFGLGKTNQISKLIIYWPDGKKTEINNPEINTTLQIEYIKSNKTDRKELSPIKRPKSYFREITKATGVNFKHNERNFDDFAREYLLNRNMSDLGPGIAVADVNGDGLDDFYVSGAKGFSGSLYIQQPNKTFKANTIDPDNTFTGFEETGCLFFDADNDHDPDLYISSGGNEDKPHTLNYKDRLYINDGKGGFRYAENSIPDSTISGSCVTAADFDKDGDMDLFIGGRQMPIHYPLPSNSMLLVNENGRFTNQIEKLIPDFKQGMVCSALWTDMDNDLDLDLITVGDWMTIEFYENQNGIFKNITESTGLPTLNGWWNSIIGGDFDEDGDIDYIAGNYGINTRLKPSPEFPVEAYYSDFDSNGQSEFLMTFYDLGKKYPVSKILLIREQFPVLQEKYKSFEQFGKESPEEIFGQKAMDEAYHLSIVQLQSMYIENKGNNSFTSKPLPILAQMSPMKGMVTVDANNDGHLDLLAHGNKIGIEPNANKQDAGTGILLLGDGNGNFTPERYINTGFLSDKDSRALALATLDNEPVVLSASNNDSLRIFGFKQINALRIYRIEPGFIAAMIEMQDGSKRKAEFYQGSGYLSQSQNLIFLPKGYKSIQLIDQYGNRKKLR
jgi:enediyne biosynthesis protein E4